MAWDEAQYVINQLKKSADTDVYTGIPPKPPSIRSVIGGTELSIIVDPPDQTCNVVLENQIVCRCNRIRLVGKIGGIPKDITDGSIITDQYIVPPVGKPSWKHDVSTGELLPMTFTYNNLTNGKTYYFRAFSQSDHGVWQLLGDQIASAAHPGTFKGRKDIAVGTPTDTYIWGFDQNFKDMNPNTTISYPDDVLNKDYKPMRTMNDHTTTADDELLTIGDWGDFLTRHLKNFPYMVKKNGEVDYALNPSDYSKKLDGSVSDYNNLNYQGGAFAWINKIYFHVEEIYEENNNWLVGRKVRFCNRKLNDTYKAIGFIDQDGVTELEGLWIPMSYTDSSGRVLIAGTLPSKSKTTAEQKSVIDNSGFQRAVFFGGPIINVLRDLEYMIFKNTNIQEKAGYGRAGVSATDHLDHIINNNLIKYDAQKDTAYAEEPDRYGFYGSSSKDSMLNKMFHSQCLGSYQAWLLDPYTILKSGQLYLSPYYRYDLNANGYMTRTGTRYSSVLSEQYMNKVKSDMDYDFGCNPDAADTRIGAASSSTGLCDAMWINHNGTIITNRLGSSYDAANMAGPAAIAMNLDVSSLDWHFSFSILLLPPVGYSPFEE